MFGRWEEHEPLERNGWCHTCFVIRGSCSWSIRNVQTQCKGHRDYPEGRLAGELKHSYGCRVRVTSDFPRPDECFN